MFKYFREKKIIKNILKKSEGKKGYVFDKWDLINVEGIENLEDKFLNEGVKIESYIENFVYPSTYLMLKSRKIKHYKIV